ncbi:MAG: hypothetical protein AAFX76_03135 [Planctomycetota bacterium]
MSDHLRLASAAFLACLLASAAPAQPIVFDFDDAKDNGDGTVRDAGGFEPQAGESGEPTVLSITTGPDGTPALAAEFRETDGFGLVAANFSHTVLGGADAPFNQVLERGGTLTGQATFTTLNGSPTAQVFMVRMGSTTGFDLTDSDTDDDNYNFTGTQAANQTFTFSFKLPALAGNPASSNLDDAGQPFYGFALGISGDAGLGSVVVFDNLTFTPNPAPAPSDDSAEAAPADEPS